MNLKKLKRIHERLKERIDKTVEKYDIQHGSNFRGDIVPNLLLKLDGNIQLIEFGAEPISTEEQLIENMKSLRTYLRLINQHPEFRESELEKMKLGKSRVYSSEEYVESARELLESPWRVQ